MKDYAKVMKVEKFEQEKKLCLYYKMNRTGYSPIKII